MQTLRNRKVKEKVSCKILSLAVYTKQVFIISMGENLYFQELKNTDACFLMYWEVPELYGLVLFGMFLI